jgi:hypothetical protein
VSEPVSQCTCRAGGCGAGPPADLAASHPPMSRVWAERAEQDGPPQRLRR